MTRSSFFWSVVWRDASLLWRIASVTFSTGPAAIAFAGAYFGWSMQLSTWFWISVTFALLAAMMLWRFFDTAFSLEKAQVAQIHIGDPEFYYFPWKGKSPGDKVERHFFVRVENLSTSHIKNCSLKEVGFRNRFGHVAPEAGRIFRRKVERHADQTRHEHDRYFDLRGKGDSVEVELCFMDERRDTMSVVMTYATSPSHIYKDSIPRSLFPHELTVSVTADNLLVPVQKTFVIDVTAEGYLSVVSSA
ncbi:hypothetical protein [Parvibaculum sp.]|uniref:hypothetical protein n=1 Tax=Parvibaculum sp. TaxID=2024848 RepID=UPI00391A5F4F